MRKYLTNPLRVLCTVAWGGSQYKLQIYVMCLTELNYSHLPRLKALHFWGFFSFFSLFSLSSICSLSDFCCCFGRNVLEYVLTFILEFCLALIVDVCFSYGIVQAVATERP